jgi:demethylmenaquinone methyltransferase/2-methoxy-6-polyprenyl-1,4-benzoquinol methylase
MSAAAGASARKLHARRLFAGIAADYDRWAQLLSFGQDARWHDLMVERLAPVLDRPQSLAADVATGTAAVAITTARRFGCRVTGIDQSPEMLEGARMRIAAAGLEGRIGLVEAAADALPLEDALVDALTHTYLLRYVDDPAATLAELARVIRPGGIMASLEFGVPSGAAYRAWRVWTRAGLPLAGVVAGPGWVETGRFLGPSIERYWEQWPFERLFAAWAAAGMRQVRAQRLSLGAGVIVMGVRSE